MGDQYVSKLVMQRFSASKADFETALNAAYASLANHPDAAIHNLVRALAFYSRSTADALIAISEQIDDVNRNINNVAARLDGKKGPFSLHMR